jgi:DNA-binding response OmpR family regulator
MITAYGDAETKRKALQNGAEALLTKPIDFGTLRSEIDMRIEGSTEFAAAALLGDALKPHLISCPGKAATYQRRALQSMQWSSRRPLRS